MRKIYSSYSFLISGVQFVYLLPRILKRLKKPQKPKNNQLQEILSVDANKIICMISDVLRPCIRWPHLSPDLEQPNLEVVPNTPF